LNLKLDILRKRLLEMRNRQPGEEVNNEELRLAAAIWLQTVWRRRRARRIYEQKKKDIRENILEGYARKIQRAYRLRKQAKLLLQQKQAKEVTTAATASAVATASAPLTPKEVKPPAPSSVRTPKLSAGKSSVLVRKFSSESDRNV
jgi:hypothetical protein